MTRRLFVVAGSICLALLTLASPAWAQSGSISGTVTDTLANPIVGIQVVACNGDTCLNSTFTIAGGAYTIPSMAAGTYRLYTFNGYFSAGGTAYIDQFYKSAPPTIECGGCQPSTSGGSTVVVSTGPITGINFSLRAGTSTLKGTITDAATGLPISGVTVNIFRTNNAWFSASSGQTNGAGPTAGQFQSRALPPGIAFTAVTFNSAGYVDKIYNNITCVGGSCGFSSGGSVTFSTATDGFTTANFQLDKGGLITGTVIATGTGLPVTFGTVTIYNSVGNTVGFAGINSFGVYTSVGLPAGSYFVKAASGSLVPGLYNGAAPAPVINCTACNVTSGAPVTVTAGATTASIDFSLATGGSITGTIRDAGTTATLSGMNVTAYTTSGQFASSASTAAGGTYTLSGLSAGTYFVKATGGNYIGRLYNGVECGSNCDVTGGTPITVTSGGTTSSIDVSLNLGGSLSGTVRDTSTPSPIALAGISVQAVTANGAFVASATTAGGGTYTLNGLTTGSYYVKVTGAGSFIPEIWAGGGGAGGAHVTCYSCQPSGGQAIAVVTGSPTSGIDFNLKAGQAISGTVTNTSSAPLSGVNIQLYNSLGSFVTSANTSGSGGYTIAGLEPGTYYLRTSQSLGYIDQAFGGLACLGCNPTAGTAIVVTSSPVTGQNFTLSLGGRVSGTITEFVSGAPLNGVSVRIYSSTGVQVTTGNTNSAGAYTSGSGLPAGTYFAITSNSLGFIDTLYNNISCFGCFGTTITSGTPIAVTAGATTSGIDMSLKPGGRITGTLTDAVSAPIVNAYVYVYSPNGSFLNSAYTNSAGAYALQGLPNGSYFVRTFTGQNYIDKLFSNIPCVGCDVTTGTPVQVAVGSTTPNVNFSLATGGSITGTVRDTNPIPNPLANIFVQVYSSGGSFITSTTTTGAGTYALSGLATGTYFLRTSNSLGYINQIYSGNTCLSCLVTSGTPVSVTAGATTSSINFSLLLGGKLTGLVRDASTTLPLPGVTVTLYTTTGSFVTSISTDGSGIYNLTGLAAGSYLVRTTNSQGYIDQVFSGLECLSCTPTNGQAVAVAAPGTTTGPTFSLVKGGRITGVVTEQATGNPISGVSVQIFRSSGSSVTSATTNAAGVWTSNSGLPAGTYVARTFNSLGYIDKLFNDVTCLGCNVIAGAQITVTAGGTTTGINFALVPGGGFSGTVLDATTSAGIASVSVQVYGPTGSFVTSGFTNGSGQYVVRGLPAGQYYARTFNSSGYIDGLYSGYTALSSTVTAGTPITVGSGSTPGINFPLTSGNRITGTIVSAAGGAPISGVSVQVYTLSGAFASSATTSPAGTYLVGGLPAGTYTARTSNSSGFVNQLYSGIPCQFCSTIGGTPIVVPAGGAGTANFTLEVGGTISGAVTDASAAPGTGVLAGSVTVSVYTTQGSFMGSATTGAAGAYAVTGLPTGNFVVRTANTGGYVDQQYLGVICQQCAYSAGTVLSVTAGGTRGGINFALSPGSRIDGTVRDAVTSAPLANVSVQIYSNSNAFVTNGTTDNSGHYVAQAGLPAGTYFARTFSSNGYISQTYLGVTCLNCAPNSGTPIPVNGTAPVTLTDIALTLGGRVSGRITDASGNPLQGMSVALYQPNGAFVASGGTNFDGSYTTQGLPSGNYYARTSNGQGYVNQVYNGVTCVRCAVTAGTPIAVTIGATTPNVNFALAVGGRISGTVTDASNGQPVGGVSVQIYNDAGFVVSSAGTSNTGSYISSAGLTPGTYYAKVNNSIGYVNQVYSGVPCALCDARTGTPIVVTAAATVGNINFALALGGRITGLITGTRTDATTGTPVTGPLQDVEVDVYTSAGGFATFAYTGTDGRFITAAGLPTGSYYLATYNQGGYIDQLYKVNGLGEVVPTVCGTNCAITSGSLVPVTLGLTTTGKDFNLTQGGRIEGRVTVEATGTPLSNVSVYIFDAVGSPIAFGYTDGLGHYVSDSGLPSGNYYVATRNLVGLVDRVFRTVNCAGCAVTSGEAVAVTIGNTTSNVDLALASGEILSGTVTDSTTGLPLSGATVRIASNVGVIVASARTDEAGNYTVATALPAGTYFARTANGLGYIDRVYDTGICLACDITRGTPIVLDGAGATGGINFALGLGGRITGVVTAASGGLPVPGSKVRVFNSAGSLIAETGTNGLGQYTSPALPPGNYYVRTYNATGFIDEIFSNVPCAPCTIAQGTAITVVTGGLRTGVDFVLDAGGVVSGYVIDQSTHAPIANVSVAIYLEATGALVATTDPTNSSGYYQISLPVGRYLVEPNPVAGYRPFVPVGLFGPSARSTVVVETGNETTGVGFSLVACAPLTVNPAALPLGAKGQLYGSTLTATGGTAPFTFSISEGNPNTGLALAASGLLAGTPVFAGTGNFTVAVTDANQCAGTRAFALTACSFFLATSSQSTSATAGLGSVDLTASTPDCPWIAGTLAPWITITSAASGTGNATVTLSFAPNTTGAARSGVITIGGQPFTVTQAGTTVSAAFGQVDTPTPGLTGVVGSLGVTGWALDDVEVKRVKISRNPVAAEPAGDVYLGDATFVDGARPDVAAANPGLPFNTRAGWGYLMLTNMLPNQGNGSTTLHVDAVDAEGNITRLGDRTFVGDNANSIRPFGAIDTPGQGATISGSNYVNFGWALTPNPKAIPNDGSTITVFIDGAPAGNPTYNNFRSDVASLFPGLANTGGAVGFRVYDTTTWTNGVHTIAWVAFDDGGQAEGIGSRYFTVNNALASQRFTPGLASMRASGLTGGSSGPAVSVRSGVDRLQPALELAPDALGGRSTTVGQLGRLELRFGQACGPVTGAQIANGERASLPVGSSIDASGAFYWMPGPAFLGTYELQFTVPSCRGGATTIPVTVTVLPGR